MIGIHGGRPATSRLESFQQKRPLEKPVESNSLVSKQLSGLTKDTVQFTGQDKPDKPVSEAHTKAASYVDSLFNECDQKNQVERMTFRDFLIKAKTEPKRYLPTASSYVLDAMDHYDAKEEPETVRVYGEPLKRHRLMDAPWNKHLSDRVRIHGQEPALNRIREILTSFKQQPNADRGITLFGPHGSGKSVLAKTLMAGVENYSRQPEGALWTYSFVFPDGEKIQPQPKAEAEAWMQKTAEQATLLEPDKIGAQLMANLNLNPIFLLPPKQRIDFIQQLKKEGKVEKDFNMDYYMKSNLEGHGQRILDRLHMLYSEHPKKFQKTMEHVQVERWPMSMQDFSGLVEVPASRNPDAMMTDLPGSDPLGKAPDLVKSAGKRMLQGLIPRAHRGIFYMDDFGRAGQPHDHLLMPLETGEVTMQSNTDSGGITKEQLDFVSIFSMNPETLERKRMDGNFEALEQRMLFVPVPWERRFKVESQILEPVIRRAKERGKQITPETGEAFALWAVMTRMFPINKNHPTYQDIGKTDKDFASGLKKLTTLGKALLYNEENAPGLSDAENKALQANIKPIATEHQQSLGETEFTLYEGGVGLSNRAAVNMMKQITARPGKEPISFIDVFESIANYAANQPQYEKKRAEVLQQKQKNIEFKPALELLKQVEDYTRQKFLTSLKNAVDTYQPPEAYVREVEKYSDHIEAMQDGRAVAPEFQIDGHSKPNIAFIKQFENTMLDGKVIPETRRRTYRSDFLTRAFDWEAKQPPGENVNRIYAEEIGQLKHRDEEQNKAALNDFQDKLRYVLKNPDAFSKQADNPAVQRFNKALSKLEEQGYPAESLPKILDWALNNKYIAKYIADHAANS